jgi:hypothetical protein
LGQYRVVNARTYCGRDTHMSSYDCYTCNRTSNVSFSSSEILNKIKHIWNASFRLRQLADVAHSVGCFEHTSLNQIFIVRSYHQSKNWHQTVWILYHHMMRRLRKCAMRKSNPYLLHVSYRGHEAYVKQQ